MESFVFVLNLSQVLNHFLLNIPIELLFLLPPLFFLSGLLTLLEVDKILLKLPVEFATNL